MEKKGSLQNLKKSADSKSLKDEQAEKDAAASENELQRLRQFVTDVEKLVNGSNNSSSPLNKKRSSASKKISKTDPSKSLAQLLVIKGKLRTQLSGDSNDIKKYKDTLTKIHQTLPKDRQVKNFNVDKINLLTKLTAGFEGTADDLKDKTDRELFAQKTLKDISDELTSRPATNFDSANPNTYAALVTSAKETQNYTPRFNHQKKRARSSKNKKEL